MLEETKHSGKTAEIIELRRQGKTWGAISTELAIPAKSLYNLRHTEGFMAAANEIWLQIWEDIDRQRKIDTHYNLNEAIKNQIKLFTLMSGTSLDGIVGSEAKTAGCTEECPYFPTHTTQKRQEVNHLINEVLKLTDKQIRRWGKYLETRDSPYRIEGLE